MLFSYFPFGGEGGGDGALIAVIDEGEGLLRHKDPLQVRGVEPELDIGVRVGRRRYIEVVEAVYIVCDTAAVIAHEGSEGALLAGERHLDDGCHGGGHVGGVHRDFPLRVFYIPRIHIGVFLLAACKNTEYRAQNTDR